MIDLIELKLAARHAGLANDRLQSTDPNLVMVRNGNCYSSVRNSLLHYDVATAPTNFFKTRSFRNRADFLPGQNAQPSQPLPLLSNKDLIAQPLLDFFRRGRFKKKL